MKWPKQPVQPFFPATYGGMLRAYGQAAADEWAKLIQIKVPWAMPYNGTRVRLK